MKIFTRLLAGVLLVVVLFVSFSSLLKSDKAAVSVQDQIVLRSFQQRLRVMSDDIISFWLKNGIDPLYGGIYATLDRAGNNIDPRNKGIIQQARHLWFFSTAYAHGHNEPEIIEAADNLYKFITEKFWDPETRQFNYLVSEDGSTVIDDRKALYAESFAVLGLSQYAMSFGNKEAARYALDCFMSFDQERHCGNFGGYDERGDGGVLRTTGDIAKGTNTHMHMMESLTALYQATGDPLVRQRLEEVLNIFTKSIFQPEGYCCTRFTLDWTPVGDHVIEYGHDFQTAWLMLDAAKVLGRPFDPEVVYAAEKMSARSAVEGFDVENGGYFFSGRPDGTVVGSAKDWWVECEALKGLWWLYRINGDVELLERMENTLNFIETHIVDSEFGEWNHGIRVDGTVNNPERKGTVWKASYHNGRLALFLDKWIDEFLDSSVLAKK